MKEKHSRQAKPRRQRMCHMPVGVAVTASKVLPLRSEGAVIGKYGRDRPVAVEKLRIAESQRARRSKFQKDQDTAKCRNRAYHIRLPSRPASFTSHSSRLLGGHMQVMCQFAEFAQIKHLRAEETRYQSIVVKISDDSGGDRRFRALDLDPIT